MTLIHKPVSLQPRGLINKGNWCYINATLQALVACPPMYHLMKFIPVFSKVQRPCTSTPMIDSFVRLMNEFTNMPVPPKPRQALGDKVMRDIRPGAAFEPTYIYRLLTVIKSSLSEKVGARPDLPCGQVPSLVLSQCLPSALSAAVKWGCCGSRLALGTFSSE